MGKSTKVIGIDISKDTFDIWSEELGHKKFENSVKRFKKLLKLLDSNSLCVMEYTASYFNNLALFLFENEIKVSVVNPLKIKRFIQMKSEHNKTDKSDAIMISKYASEQTVILWKPSSDYIRKSGYLNTTIRLKINYQRQATHKN